MNIIISLKIEQENTLYFKLVLAQSAGAVEYTDCLSVEG